MWAILISLTVVPRKKVGTQGRTKSGVKLPGLEKETSGKSAKPYICTQYILLPSPESLWLLVLHHHIGTIKTAKQLSEANKPAVLIHVLNSSTNQDSVTRGEFAQPATLALENTSQTLTVRKKNTLMKTCLILKLTHRARIKKQYIKSYNIFRRQMGTEPRCTPKPIWAAPVAEGLCRAPGTETTPSPSKKR